MDCEHEWIFNQDYEEQSRTESYTCRKCGESVTINCEAESITEHGGRVIYACCCGFETSDIDAVSEHRDSCEKHNRFVPLVVMDDEYHEDELL